MSLQDKLEQVRKVALELGERAKTDEEFRAQIENDPVGTLTAAGLPGEVVGDFLRDTGLAGDGEVQGYWGICVNASIIQ